MSLKIKSDKKDKLKSELKKNFGDLAEAEISSILDTPNDSSLPDEVYERRILGRVRISLFSAKGRLSPFTVLNKDKDKARDVRLALEDLESDVVGVK
jgi:hypothetical protein